MIEIKIDKILERQNKSLYWLAQETGLSYPTIHRLVSGKTTSISFDTLEKICLALNCTPNDIFDFKKE